MDKFCLNSIEMDKLPLISVIIPVYNTEIHLAKCIESILGQTYSNLEILLIDDGSTDNSPAICDGFSNRDNRVKVYHKKNGGVSSARNWGLESATGDFVSFVDSDDWLEEQTYRTLINCIEKHKVDAVIFEYFIDYTNGESRQPSHKDMEGLINNYRAVELTISPVNRFAVTKMYGKRIIDSNRFDTSIYFGEDTLFACTVLSKAHMVYYLAKPFYHYYQSDISATRSKFNPKVLTGLEAYSRVVEMCVAKFPNIADVALSAYFNMIVNILVELEKQTSFPNSKIIRRRLLSTLRKDLRTVLMSTKIQSKLKLKFLIGSISPSILKHLRN